MKLKNIVTCEIDFDLSPTVPYLHNIATNIKNETPKSTEAPAN